MERKEIRCESEGWEIFQRGDVFLGDWGFIYSNFGGKILTEERDDV